MLNKNNERELAYTVRIDDIKSIEGADRVEIAMVRGWTVMVRKGQFKPGDLAIYFEIDSKVPETDPFKFLEAKHYKIKTQKYFKGTVISQGLLMGASDFGWETKTDSEGKVVSIGGHPEGDFLTKELNVTYAEPEDNRRKGRSVDKYKKMAGRHPKLFQNPIIKAIYRTDKGKKFLFKILGNKKKDTGRPWPEWVVKTDEERCLVGDTKIRTDAGDIRIADIVNKKLPVKVLSYNQETDSFEYKPIVSYQRYAVDSNEDLLVIKYPYKFGCQRTNTIICSKDHRFFDGKDYIRAEKLLEGKEVFIHHNAYTDEIISIVFGMLLGDSCVYYDKRQNGDNIRINTTQGEDQLDYLRFKMSLFGDNNYKIYKGKSGYCDKAVYSSSLITDRTISSVVNKCYYKNNKKTITKEMLQYITPASLAIWYMDNGSLKHKNDGLSPSIILSTCRFSLEENNLLIDMLKEKFNIESNLRREKNYWSIYITTKGTIPFLTLVTKYMPKCMRYKTVDSLMDEPFVLENVSFDRKEKLFPVEVRSIKPYTGLRRYKTIYDLEIEDNHNFFANNILTHNCQNMPWILQDKSPWIATEKIDGTSTTFTMKRGRKNWLGKVKNEFYVCSRNVVYDTPEQGCYYETNPYVEMAERYHIEEVLEMILTNHPEYDWVTIQGETYGAGIQKRTYTLDILHQKNNDIPEHDFCAFNFITSKEGRWNSVKACEILKSFGISWVPIVDTEFILPDTIEELLDKATGKSVVDGGMREGLVFRSQDGKKSFKAVSNEYLLKYHG